MMNTLKSPATELVPLAMSSDGVINVGGSRVSLDSVLAVFNDGSTAEEIVQQFPALALADVYAVLTYYLRRQAEIDEYLRERQATAEQVRRDNAGRFDPHGVRARLLARRAAPICRCAIEDVFKR